MYCIYLHLFQRAAIAKGGPAIGRLRLRLSWEVWQSDDRDCDCLGKSGNPAIAIAIAIANSDC
jgi:hypothetical protein